MKRGNKEGTIFKRTDGRYAGAITLDTGKRAYVYGKTREEAADKLAALQVTVRQGLPIPDQRITVGRFLEDWLEQTVKTSVRQSTYEAYAAYTRNHIIPGIGRTKLAKLTPQIVQAFLDDCEKKNLSPRSVNHIRAILRGALNKALQWGMVHRNAAALASPRRLVHTEPNVLSAEQANQFLEYVADDEYGALYTVALTVGLRLGEALGLAWDDINFDQGTLRVRQAVQYSGGKTHLVEPKSRTSRRSLTLPALALAALQRHKAREDARRQDTKCPVPANPHKLVFLSRSGGLLNPSSATRRFQEKLTEAGLPKMRFHDLRHSTATLLLSRGVHPRLVMELLGHSQISLTMNTYSHVIPQMQRETADAMDGLLAISAS